MRRGAAGIARVHAPLCVVLWSFVRFASVSLLCWPSASHDTDMTFFVSDDIIDDDAMLMSMQL